MTDDRFRDDRVVGRGRPARHLPRGRHSPVGRALTTPFSTERSPGPPIGVMQMSPVRQCDYRVLESECNRPTGRARVSERRRREAPAIWLSRKPTPLHGHKRRWLRRSTAPAWMQRVATPRPSKPGSMHIVLRPLSSTRGSTRSLMQRLSGSRSRMTSLQFKHTGRHKAERGGRIAGSARTLRHHTFAFGTYVSSHGET